ncbi:MAG: glycosyltransferase [Pseudomonadota bacterium]
MKLVHVVPHTSDEAAGTAYVALNTCESLANLGCDVTLMTADSAPVPTPHKFRHEHYPGLAWTSTFAHSPGLRAALYRAAETVDVIHNHSIFTMPNTYPGAITRRTGVPLVCAPHGTLAPVPLSRGKLRKRLFWHFGQKHTMTEAQLLHATAELEVEDIRAFGLKNPVAVIPNGVTIPQTSHLTPADGTRTVLYLARLHPTKGLGMLLEVWRDLPAEMRQGWQLKLVGPGPASHVTELKDFCREHDMTDAIFTGPLYGDEKLQAYIDADVHIHSSPDENFGQVIAEAMAAGTPVICTTGTPWSGVLENDCGWWIERGHEQMRAALIAAMSKPRAELDAMGQRGRAWMARDYGWDAIGRTMIACYEWVLGGKTGPAPDCVHF